MSYVIYFPIFPLLSQSQRKDEKLFWEIMIITRVLHFNITSFRVFFRFLAFSPFISLSHCAALRQWHP